MFGMWFHSSFVNVFVVCVLLLAFDFWTVKNVSGRLMVGLRWWSEVQDDGSQHWRFEAQEVRLRPRLPGRSPFCSRQRCAQPHPHAACGHTGESAEHDARYRRLLGRLASAGAQLVGTSLPSGREPESHGQLAEREPERPGATGLRLAPPACAGCHESAPAPPHEPACTADGPLRPDAVRR